MVSLHSPILDWKSVNLIQGGSQEQKKAVEEARKLAYEQRQEAIETARGQKAKDSFIQSLKNQADAIGKTKTELLEMKVAQLPEQSIYNVRMREMEEAQKVEEESRRKEEY